METARFSLPLKSTAWRWGQLETLDIGEGVFVADSEFPFVEDPNHSARGAAWALGKRCGIKFETRKKYHNGVLGTWIIRVG
jgi:hypothetical protein